MKLLLDIWMLSNKQQICLHLLGDSFQWYLLEAQHFPEDKDKKLLSLKLYVFHLIFSFKPKAWILLKDWISELFSSRYTRNLRGDLNEN